MKILFCGVGALGSHAVVLCRNLDAEIVLVDGDRVETKNLAAQAYVKPSLGKNKADALKLQLANFHGRKVEAFGVRLVDSNIATIAASADLLVDAFDNAESRRMLSTWATSANKPLVHAGISGDGTFGIVRWDARFTADEEDAPGQPTCEGGAHLPLVAAIGATMARTVQDFVERGERRDWMISLGGIVQTAEG